MENNKILQRSEAQLISDDQLEGVNGGMGDEAGAYGTKMCLNQRCCMYRIVVERIPKDGLCVECRKALRNV